MLKLIKKFHDLGNKAIDNYAELDDILAIPAKEKIGRAKYIEESAISSFDEISAELETEMRALASGGKDDE